MATSWTHILKKIDDYRWEIPTSYKPGMRVPGLVFADERMLRQIAEEQALEQVANVATLPGIVGYSLAMPDIHWGYGFPVGGVAAFRVEDGIISPGGIGYDVNCLYGDANVLHEFGYHRPIHEFEQRWSAERIMCIHPNERAWGTSIAAFIKHAKPVNQVFEITTESGLKIVATEDHPFLTPHGMTSIKDVSVSEFVAVYPFEGVAFEEPSDEVLVTEEDVAKSYPGHENGLAQTLRALKLRDFLPLRMNDPRIPYLVKLMGFIHGDGSIQLRRRGALVTFNGSAKDLEDIRRDILTVGFLPSRVYSRHREHFIETHYGPKRFRTTEASVHIGSSAFALLVRCLGVPVGNKAGSNFEAPPWLDRAPLWMKRLYLAALFGAELTAPTTVSGHPYNFYTQVLSMNKRPELAESGRRYFRKIEAWLAEFGVESSIIGDREERVGRDSSAVRLRLQISSKPENLIQLWTGIGFEYNRRKQFLACAAAQYLRLKLWALKERELSVEFARAMHARGVRAGEIAQAVGSPYVSQPFVEHAIWNAKRRGVRIGTAFPGFKKFLEERTRDLGKTGQVWDVVVRKRAIPFDGPVYDFTVDDPHHNFIANGFVVSNCGVRLVRTNLTESDVRAKIQPLVDALFVNVPSGVGSTGRIKVSMGEIDDVLEGGARWAVQKGYGRQDDIDVIEAHGSLPQADPDAVSQAAKQRGRGQIGTLGSGNHFLEVQVVDEVFDARTAAALGVDQVGQVVVFVHCGSRGLGHQVCTDYLRVAERSAREHGIALVDRQLACMPFQSPDGQQYFGAMCASANFAWANRQMITHWVREAFSRVFAQSPESLGMELIYDVAHNIGKIEEYQVDGQTQRLVVHRKGATRAFPAGHPEVPDKYRAVGQPVLVPGDMGRYSFVAVGTEQAMRISFGSTCHGAGRLMGRKQAVRTLAGVDVAQQLRQQGILVRAQDRGLLAEEAPVAYKDVADVVGICQAAGLSRRVARTRPLGVVKG